MELMRENEHAAFKQVKHPRLMRGKEFFDQLRVLLNTHDEHEFAKAIELPIETILAYERQNKVHFGEAMRLNKLLKLPLNLLLFTEA